MAYKIELRQECPKISVSEAGLKKLAIKILKDLGFKKAELSILLVDDKKMRFLNRKYLKHAYSTDVLSFSEKHVDAAGKRAIKTKSNTEDFLGDIALCPPQIKKQAKEYEHTFEEELHYCLCHGILHLIGYKDKNKIAFKKMHRKQTEILSRVA